MQAGVGQVRLGLNTGRGQHREPVAVGHLPGLVEQGRLPDSCLAPDHEHAAAPGGAGQQQFDRGDFRRTTDSSVLPVLNGPVVTSRYARVPGPETQVTRDECVYPNASRLFTHDENCLARRTIHIRPLSKAARPSANGKVAAIVTCNAPQSTSSANSRVRPGPA